MRRVVMTGLAMLFSVGWVYAVESTPSATTIDADAYADVVVRTFRTLDVLPDYQEAELIKLARQIIGRHFSKTAAGNATAYKFGRFEAGFPKFLSLERIGLPFDSKRLTNEKFNFYKAHFTFGLTTFLSRKPDPDQDAALARLFLKIEDRYVDSLERQFPDYARLVGHKKLAQKVFRFQEENLVQAATDYFQLSSLLLTVQQLETHLERLPDVKRTFPEAGKQWLEKLKDPKLSIQDRALYEHQYGLVMDRQVEEVLRAYTFDLMPRQIDWTRILAGLEGFSAERELMAMGTECQQTFRTLADAMKSAASARAGR